MNPIRSLCKEQGTCPFYAVPAQVYFTVAVEKLIRTMTDLRITSAFMDPSEVIGVSDAAESEVAQFNRAVSCDRRLNIQEPEDAIWNATTDDRCAAL